MTVNLAIGERFADDVPPRISGKEDLLACQDTACAVCTSHRFARAVGAKKPRSSERGFFICVRRTQHHLTEGQHHFEQSENIILHLCGHQNDVATSRK